MTSCVKELKWYVSLRRMLFAAVSCVCVSGISSYFDVGSSTFSRRVSVELWNVLMKHSDVELWTTEMSFQCNVRLMNNIRRWIFCYWMNSFVKTFILLWREMLLRQRLLMEHFSLSVHHLLRLQPARRTFIISSLVLTMKTSASRLLLRLWIVIDNILSQLRETV